MNIFERIANEQIEEAMKRGEFDNLPGQGQPIDLEDDANIPPEHRLAFRIMKNAGVTPVEVSLRKELEALRAEHAKTRNLEQRDRLEREIRMMCLRIAVQTKDAKERR